MPTLIFSFGILPVKFQAHFAFISQQSPFLLSSPSETQQKATSLTSLASLEEEINTLAAG